MRCDMSLAIHFLNSHLDLFFPNLNMGKVSAMEERYARKSSQNMLADYCWNVTEEVTIASHKQRSYRKKVLNLS